MLAAQCVPSSEDMQALEQYKRSGRPVSELGEAERVVLELMSVPTVEARLRCYSYKFQAPHKLDSAKGVRRCRRRGAAH